MRAYERLLLLTCVLPLSACGGPAGDAAVAADSAPLWAAQNAYWGPAVIPVCWEELLPTAFTEERGWVQESVDATWASSAPVTFTGWQPCASPTQPGIHIRISDERPYSQIGVAATNGRASGMTLNFTFNNWNTTNCLFEREKCIRDNAIHEFGHALGYLHEQDRPDNPGCTNGVDATTGPGIYLSAYDPSSIMNYCASYRTTLSDLDVYGHQSAYGWAPLDWQFSGTVPTYTPVAAVSRARSYLDVFRVGSDGQVYTASGAHHGGGAGSWTPVGAAPARFSVTARLTAVARTPDIVELYGVALDGAVYRTWRNFTGGGWQAWQRLGTLPVASGTRVSAVVRDAARVDLFVAGADHGVYTYRVQPAIVCFPAYHCPPHDWARIGTQTTYAPLSAVSRAPDLVDLFIKGTDGIVYTAWRVDGSGWNAWYPIFNAVSDPYAPVAVAARPRRLDLFVTGYDGHVYRAWFDESVGWQAWALFGRATFPYWGELTTLVQDPETVHLFGVAADGKLYTAWLDPTGAWRDFYALSQVHAGVALPAGTPVTALGHPEGYVRNGLLPLGTLTGWTTTSASNGTVGSGYVSVFRDPAVGNSFQLGTSQTFGSPLETTLSQWVTVPRLFPQLRYRVRSVCPDSVANDWTTVEIHGAAGQLLATSLARTCSNDGTWTVPITDLSPFAGQTVELRFINHDDGRSGTATVSQFNDVEMTYLNTSDAHVGSAFSTGENDLFVVDGNGDILSSSYDVK